MPWSLRVRTRLARPAKQQDMLPLTTSAVGAVERAASTTDLSLSPRIQRKSMIVRHGHYEHSVVDVASTDHRITNYDDRRGIRAEDSG